MGLANKLITRRKTLNMSQVIFLAYRLYFLFIGFSAVKFMRYMLPIYPFITILAAYGLDD